MLNQIADIADRILALRSENPTRIAVDGFCAAGKSTIANHLASRLAASGRPVIRVSTDDFQNPPDIRWQDGKQSPRGFYFHAIDFDSLRTKLLAPLGPNGSRHYHTSTYDIRRMKPNLSPLRVADSTSLLIVDGLFLLTAGLRAFWEFSIFVDTSYETCIERARLRNQEQLSDAGEVETVYRKRYVPGFQLYLDEDRPKDLASVIIQNEKREDLRFQTSSI